MKYLKDWKKEQEKKDFIHFYDNIISDWQYEHNELISMLQQAYMAINDCPYDDGTPVIDKHAISKEIEQLLDKLEGDE